MPAMKSLYPDSSGWAGETASLSYWQLENLNEILSNFQSQFN